MKITCSWCQQEEDYGEIACSRCDAKFKYDKPWKSIYIIPALLKTFIITIVLTIFVYVIFNSFMLPESVNELSQESQMIILKIEMLICFLIPCAFVILPSYRLYKKAAKPENVKVTSEFPRNKEIFYDVECTHCGNKTPFGDSSCYGCNSKITYNNGEVEFITPQMQIEYRIAFEQEKIRKKQEKIARMNEPVPCPFCKIMISKQAVVCPGCGAEIQGIFFKRWERYSRQK